MPAKMRGVAEPRLAPEPARRLTKHTTKGYEAITFAEDVLGVELLPWQRWWLLHALETDTNGDFRYRTVLTLVGRQNGKTTLLKILALWMMYMGHARLVLGSAQSLDIARESWEGAVELATDVPELSAEVSNVRRANGEQTLALVNGARYKIAASSRSAGRGLSVDLLILDELREHRDWAAWSALSKTTTARPCALTVAISNAGDDESVVLNTLRQNALANADPTLAVFEWSAEEGCELDDEKAWAQANPGLGYTITASAIRSALATDPPGVFRTETLCQRVEQLDGAVDMGAWKASKDPTVNLDGLRDRVVTCVDVSPDGQHVSLIAAADLPNERARVEVVRVWPSVADCARELGGLLDKIGARREAWFPNGPGAALAGIMRNRPKAFEITGGKVAESNMHFASLVSRRGVEHPDDPLLNAQLSGAAKMPVGDGWRFTRRGSAHADAAYAGAGAVHVALTEPFDDVIPRPMIV